MICIIMLDIIHQKKEHMIMKFLYDFFHKSIKTKQRIIALNNDGFVLLSEFQLMSIGFSTQRAIMHAMYYICYQTFKTFFTDFL